MPVSLLEIENLSKTFPSGRALHEFDVTLTTGEVHALVGQNGSGKSTFIKVLSGYHTPDPGAVARFRGVAFDLGDPHSKTTHAIHYVHQDLGLIDDMSAMENLAIGSGFATGRGGRIKWRKQRRQAFDAIESLGYAFDPTRPVRALSQSERVGTAIARALTRSPDGKLDLLVLDEPTASLPQAEVDNLFAVLRKLRSGGTTVLFVSHRLDEVFDIADRVTVLRDGRRVSTKGVGDFDHEGLVAEILGRTLEIHHEQQSRVRSVKPSLVTRGLAGDRLRALDLEAYPGEVLGVAGITGSGREEVGPLLFGARTRTAGTVEIAGSQVKRLTPGTAKRRGVALVPSERRTAAVLPDSNVRENLTIASLKAYWATWRLRRRAERVDTKRWLGVLQVLPAEPEAQMLHLSGGNQQKVLLARWLRLQPRVLILDEPTQGVDVGTKPEIYTLLRAVAAGGTAVVVCSTDSEEIAEVCDRVLILAKGRQSSEISGEELSVDRLNQEIVRA